MKIFIILSMLLSSTSVLADPSIINNMYTPVNYLHNNYDGKDRWQPLTPSYNVIFPGNLKVSVNSGIGYLESAKYKGIEVLPTAKVLHITESWFAKVERVPVPNYGDPIPYYENERHEKTLRFFVGWGTRF